MTPSSYNANRPKGSRHAGDDRAPELVAIPGTVALAESAKALRCEFRDGARCWVPKSKIALTSEVKRRGQCGRLVVSARFAKAAGIVGYAGACAERAIRG
jgi:hypothetical protein